jgi:hypothetical protein
MLPWQNVISPAGDLTVFCVPIIAFSAVTYFIDNVEYIPIETITPVNINTRSKQELNKSSRPFLYNKLSIKATLFYTKRIESFLISINS